MVYVRATKTALLNRIPRGAGVTPLAGYTEQGCVFDWPDECGPPDPECTEVLEPGELVVLGLSDGKAKRGAIKKKARRPAVGGPKLNEDGELER